MKAATLPGLLAPAPPPSEPELHRCAHPDCAGAPIYGAAWACGLGTARRWFCAAHRAEVDKPHQEPCP